LEDCLAAPHRDEVKNDGCFRHGGHVTMPEETEPRILRIVTLEDAVTIHNAFLDRAHGEALIAPMPVVSQGAALLSRNR